MDYQSNYSWDNGITLKIGGVEAMEHSDGSVSLAITWDGLSTELQTDEKIRSLYGILNKALHLLPRDNRLFVENHCLREFNRQVCDEYVQYGETNSVRHQKFGNFIRQAMAETIAGLSMDNRVVTVFTLRRSLSPLAAIRPRKAFDKIKEEAIRLYDIAAEYATQLPNARFLSYAEFEAFIWQCYHRDRARGRTIPATNPRFKLAHRVAEKPTWEHDLLRIGDTYTKVMLLLDYPDAAPNWFYNIASRFGCEIHITQIISPANMTHELLASTKATKTTSETAGQAGGENEKGKLLDHNDFRAFVANNNLSIFKNAYIIKFHHIDADELRDIYRRFRSSLDGEAVLADSSRELSYVYWRVSQPGQGYRTPFMRPDHTLQVANMAPILRFRDADPVHRQMLRVTSDAKAITLSFPPGGTNHTITAAKTNSGKGVETCAKICELFPLGVNFYIAEVGPTYKMLVEAFGGTYFHLDPNSTVVSPFPDYNLANLQNATMPLSADIVAPTIGALLPLLARQKDNDIANHITSVAEQMMQAMYAFRDESLSLKSPTLDTFYKFAKNTQSEFSGVQKKAATVIVENLDSFLSSTAGQNFCRADTLDFNSGIVGVDFKPLMNNEEMAKFMFVFIALRYKQLAFANDTPTRIVLDEQHEFNRIDRELMTTLAKQLTRMGRKEAGAYHGISQEPLDMGLEPGILNQVTHREFMYMQDGHEGVAQAFKMNSAALARWQAFSDPEMPGKTQNYRQCLRMLGEDSFDLHLKFPQVLLDLANSSPKGLKIKAEICAKTRDPFERLRLLREALAA